jgi:four helix bundle protein
MPMLEKRSVAPSKYDLEERTLRFAKSCLEICRLLEKSRINGPLIDQLIRSATSVGANYREANESLTTKDFYYRLNICRKEAKESKYWLELLQDLNVTHEHQIGLMVQEALELVRIFSSIVLRHRS